MTTANTVRRGLFGMFAGGLLAFGSAAIIAPVASAQPAPGPAPAPDCSASSVAGTVSTAAASEGAFLTANPQANEALSKISAEPQPQADQAYMAYFAENPQVQDQLKAIHEPVSALQDRCGVKLAPTPVAQAVWSASDQSPEVPVTPAPEAESEMPTA
ncbi:MAG: hemophore-related protein [Actinomycetota bacterium]